MGKEKHKQHQHRKHTFRLQHKILEIETNEAI